MAYIQPNSRIEFFTDLGLSQDYNDTLFFETEHDKDLYFDNVPNRLAYVDKCYYARENRGFVRVELPMSTMISAQYMRFKNTSYENKWWYAFVKDVNYINDHTTEVQFELDTMLTWMGSFTLSQCFVERQHNATDEIGDNIVDEPVNIGTYVVNQKMQSGYFDKWVYLVFITPNLIGQIAGAVDTHDKLGIYSGMGVLAIPDDSITEFGEINPDQHVFSTLDILRSALVFFGEVQMVAYVPYRFLPHLDLTVHDPNDTFPWSEWMIPATLKPPVSLEIDFPKRAISDGGLDGYTQVKNNKLFTAPYNVLTAMNTEGAEQTYRFEFFKEDENFPNLIRFRVDGSVNEKVQITMYPIDYKGQELNDEETLSMGDFPYVAWGSDAFAAYLAQTLSNSPVKLLAQGNSLQSSLDSAFSSMAEIESGSGIKSDYVGEFSKASNYLGMETIDSNSFATKSHTQDYNKGVRGYESNRKTGLDSLSSAFNISSSVNIGGNIGKAVITPNRVTGSSFADIAVLNRRKDFWLMRKSINNQAAEIIDSYFTMFGYAQKKIMTPQMNVRPYFTYVKTKDCKINCECPATDANVIEALFNKGIRFWKRHTDIGHYEVNNAPMQGGNP